MKAEPLVLRSLRSLLLRLKPWKIWLSWKTDLEPWKTGSDLGQLILIDTLINSLIDSLVNTLSNNLINIMINSLLNSLINSLDTLWTPLTP